MALTNELKIFEHLFVVGEFIRRYLKERAINCTTTNKTLRTHIYDENIILSISWAGARHGEGQRGGFLRQASGLQLFRSYPRQFQL